MWFAQFEAEDSPRKEISSTDTKFGLRDHNDKNKQRTHNRYESESIDNKKTLKKIKTFTT